MNEMVKAAKQKRLAEALRANLKRRKEAARRPDGESRPGHAESGEVTAGSRRQD